MTTITLEQFTATAMDEGFDEIIVREWAPDLAIDVHTHPFDVSAVVVRGELRLTLAQKVLHLKAGDPFRLARNIEHAELYGEEGATVWVAKAS